jgi:tRNA (uracil-5-)-methyltransferase
MLRKPDNLPTDSRPKRKRGNGKVAQDGGSDQVLQLDVAHLLKIHAAETTGEIQDSKEPIHAATSNSRDGIFPETEVTISELSSIGDGLAISPSLNHVYVVPFAVPGDTVRVKVIKSFLDESYSLTDLVEVIKPSPRRDDSLINCQYFGKCSGCQFQMLSYSDQLAHKKRIIEKAFANFSGILPELIPSIGDTMPSPLQYGYRTKLTPHFTIPGSARRHRREAKIPAEVPPIGFTIKGRRTVMDIEDCPLGTETVRRGLKSERKRVAENLHLFPNGATLLIRESTTRKARSRRVHYGGTAHNDHAPEEDSQPTLSKCQSTDDQDIIRTEYTDYVEEKCYITNSRSISYEYVDGYRFKNQAGAFFQNNNSILSTFTAYIRDHALRPAHNVTGITPATQTSNHKLKYLLDAYSGCGLFTVTLSPLFKSSLGIDISSESIRSARENARVNQLPNTGFAAADAADLFKEVPYPPDQTLLIIDPPRKGCGDNFLHQLMTFGPARVIYVSCNVHSQARDIGKLVQGSGRPGDTQCRYEIESIKGFDFFPQTGHVEGVAILNKVLVGVGKGDVSPTTIIGGDKTS